MNDPFLTDRDGAEAWFRWHEAPPGRWTCAVEPRSCQGNVAVASEPDV